MVITCMTAVAGCYSLLDSYFHLDEKAAPWRRPKTSLYDHVYGSAYPRLVDQLHSMLTGLNSINIIEQKHYQQWSIRAHRVLPDAPTDTF